jgi:hypothetical protein
MNDLEVFARLARTLAPWSAQLVYIGGWAHRIHRLDPSANTPAHQAVFTRDTDLAFAATTPIHGDIKAALAGSGFREQLSGETKPPVAHYVLGEESQGFYAEFLTPLAGSGRKRNGQPDATLERAGISAQKIRDLDILLVDPWVVTLSPANSPLETALDIQVANPLAFMVQKFLIQAQRPPEKRAQDILYIFDTIELFGAHMDALHRTWTGSIGPALGSKARAKVLRLAEETFSKVTDDLRRAALIPQDRKLTADEIRATGQFAFERILGG